MLGQPASSHTVCSPPERTSDLSSVYCGPVRALVLIHGGLCSIGVSLLRTSRRRSLRPSGAMVTSPGYAAGSVLHGVASTWRERRDQDAVPCGSAHVDAGAGELEQRYREPQVA